MYKKILIATDLTEAMEPVYDVGAKYAEVFDAAVHVLHVFSIGPIVNTSPANLEYLADVKSQLQKKIAKEVPGYLGETLDVTSSVVQGLSTVTELEDYATAQNIDLILVGTHGRQGFKRFFLGSVAEGIIRRAPCSGIVVRTQVAA